jgi:hypothetical protein
MKRSALLALALLGLACSSGSPSAPSSEATARSTVTGSDAGVRGSNAAPILELRTTPSLAGDTISGRVPLQVRINMCRSSDADPGDSLRFDVAWGDGTETGPDDPGAGTTPEDGGPPTGCDGKDCCRHRHLFTGAGSFTVEASVTDKHLEDQGAAIGALARATRRFTVSVGVPEAPETPTTVTPLPTGSMTFSFTGAMQTFVVPAGVTQVTIEAFGAQGGAGSNGTSMDPGAGGNGGAVTATIAVAPGDTLSVLVGGRGGDGTDLGGGTSGWNGGGPGGTGPGYVAFGVNLGGGGGGGASDVRHGGGDEAHRVIVAGGGGGGGTGGLGGADGGGNGGLGGGLVGVAGAEGGGPPGLGGAGGTQTAGGAGGASSSGADGGDGDLATGGDGGEDVGGGGGGAGYFGGGGGGDFAIFPNLALGGGGGGGSSFAIPAATGVVHQQGVRSGHGLVIISW